MSGDTSGDIRGASEGRGKGSNLLKCDTEFLHSFLRVDDGDESREGEGGTDADKRKAKRRAAMQEREKEKEREKAAASQVKDKEKDKRRKEERARTPTPPPAGPATFSQLSREIKMKQKQSVKSIRGKKVKVRRQEEIYTDKDRAAAVNLGSRDIKQSLKMKRRQDRSRSLMIPEEAEPGTLLALGSHELRAGHVPVAINFVNKALELSPNDKNALVARSKCYLLLGEPHLALEDAETALSQDKTFIRGIYQKAEALYHLGDFEHSLMFYHRGLRIRPELEGFRLGVQKAQEAIENTIGSKIISSAAQKGERASISLTNRPQTDNKSDSDKLKDLINSSPNIPSSGKRSEPGSASTVRSAAINNATKYIPGSNVNKLKEEYERKKNDRHLLGDLSVDKHYLEELLKQPDLKGINDESKSQIEIFAEEGVAFLNNRQEFWRQQRPKAISKSKKKDKNN